MNTKKELRDKYKKLRASLSEEQIAQNSLEIANQVLKLPIWDKTYYHIFLPIVRLKEIDTELIIQILMGKDQEIVIAKSDFETFSMQHFLLTDNTKIEINTWGIPEPVNGLKVPVSNIDVVFVPVLAFDQSGNRVGYGKGFYDRFLAECRPDVLKIGLSFFEPEAFVAEISDNDIKLDYCVTMDEIYRF
uniref:5-formyltetrahydrofolate cyclo-ligase n=1 Tax=Flavobacterium sp. TaxID=239 RepID=UPI00404AA692